MTQIVELYETNQTLGNSLTLAVRMPCLKSQRKTRKVSQEVTAAHQDRTYQSKIKTMF